ncbi:MAG: hypothetical protein JWQ09_3191 [Segetibacter sp.]|nr:hypothetical protein [Segetibacter sp.]
MLTLNQKAQSPEAFYFYQAPKSTWIEVFEQDFKKETPNQYLDSIHRFEEIYNLSSFSKLICSYSQVDFRIKGNDLVDFLLKEENQRKFGIETSYDAASSAIVNFSGNFLNCAFEACYSKQQWITKFFVALDRRRESKMSANYYWTDFVAEMKRLSDAFQFNFNTAEIIALKARIKITLPLKVKESIGEIIGSIISVFEKENFNRYSRFDNAVFLAAIEGKAVRISGKEFQKKGIKRKGIITEYMSDEHILFRSKIKYLSDLLQISKLNLFNDSMFEALETIHIGPPKSCKNWDKIIKVNNFEELKISSDWVRLNESNRNMYLENKSLHERLVRYYCPYSLEDVILQAFKVKLTIN